MILSTCGQMIGEVGLHVMLELVEILDILLELVDGACLHLDLLIHLVELEGKPVLHLIDSAHLVQVPEELLAHVSSPGP